MLCISIKSLFLFLILSLSLSLSIYLSIYRYICMFLTCLFAVLRCFSMLLFCFLMVNIFLFASQFDRSSRSFSILQLEVLSKPRNADIDYYYVCYRGVFRIYYLWCEFFFAPLFTPLWAPFAP